MTTTAQKAISITAPNLQVAVFTIEGDAPLVINAFPEKAARQMADKMLDPTKKKTKNRDARNFSADCLASSHIATDPPHEDPEAEVGWFGLPASAFRAGMVRACSLVGMPMTLGKLSIFVLADGYEARTMMIGGKAYSGGRQPLIRITRGTPEETVMPMPNANGQCDLRARPMWAPGWQAVVRIRFDADQFSIDDVANLLSRMGAQVGICAGRPSSSKSSGCGWGTFVVGRSPAEDVAGEAKPHKNGAAKKKRMPIGDEAVG